MNKPPPATRVRLDKWLWAARFYKTRSLASDEVGKGRVRVNGLIAKSSRELHVSDEVELRQGAIVRSVTVQALSEMRGPATVAQTLYVETAASVALREKTATENRYAAEPARAIEQGRPTKRDRRQWVDWNRWSATVDPE
ncbi:MAG TPA: RNA-binding S4 domain-containing protein [Rhizobacter sp.]|nr:RNA-binding S4 domain-containing protein [Rhizobacter sp.]